MEIALECLPCILKQQIEASRLAGADAALQERVLQLVLRMLGDYPAYRLAPALTRDIGQKVAGLTGCEDPYRQIKLEDIRASKLVLPQVQAFLDSCGHTLYAALKASATGNILDSAVYSGMNLDAILSEELLREFALCDLPAFEEKLAGARTLLILGDNAGEAVFDGILIDELVALKKPAPFRVIYAVRERPALNDVTWAEAVAAGLAPRARIISSGSTAAGTILEECTPEFLEIYRSVDLVLSKGQGNYEGLSEPGSPRDVFYLLKAKCSAIARSFGVPVGSYIFHYQPAPEGKTGKET